MSKYDITPEDQESLGTFTTLVAEVYASTNPSIQGSCYRVRIGGKDYLLGDANERYGMLANILDDIAEGVDRETYEESGTLTVDNSPERGTK